MHMKLPCVVLPLLLTACSVVPRQDDVTRVSTHDIVQRVRCEAKRAVTAADNYYRAANRRLVIYKKATIAYEFDFDVTEENNASGSAGWGLNYPLGGTFGLGANAGLAQNLYTKRNIKVTDTFDQLRAMNCTPASLHQNGLYPIAGDIGVYELVMTFIRLQQVDNKRSGNVFTFGDTLMFTTILTGGIKPTLVISPLTEALRLAGASGDFNARRQDIHKVILTLAGDPEKIDDMPIAKSLQQAPAVALAAGTNSLTGITILQALTDPTARALLELDRQRILAVQNKAQALVVSP